MSEAANHGNPGQELISFRIGAQEFLLPSMQPAWIWEKPRTFCI